MAKRTLGDLRKFLSRVEREVLSKQSNEELAKEARDIVFKRTKSGFGVTNDQSDRGLKKRLKPLSPGYIEQRRKRGVSGKFGSPGFSNLTNTGQMLDSMRFFANDDGFTLEIPPSRRRDGETNRRVADYVRDARPFFALTAAEVRILEKIVSDKVLRIFKRSF